MSIEELAASAIVLLGQLFAGTLSSAADHVGEELGRELASALELSGDQQGTLSEADVVSTLSSSPELASRLQAYLDSGALSAQSGDGSVSFQGSQTFKATSMHFGGVNKRSAP
jgi:hypothetical protein